MDIVIDFYDQTPVANAEAFEKWLIFMIDNSRFSDSVIQTQLNYGCEKINES